MLGLESQLVQSKLGNYFAINSVKTILANEMANPLVRKEMVFYPQENSNVLKHAANGAQWTEEVNASLVAPMVRKYLPHGHHDYYVYEPFVVSVSSVEDPSIFLPHAYISVRYFQQDNKCFTKCHPLIPHDNGFTSIIIDANIHVNIPTSNFLLPLPEFWLKYEDYGLLSPDVILGAHHLPSEDIHPWDHPIENSW
ncbi:hypothetical protein RSAG8_13567, partial [Rhizoctonia solani AG-8 WAC10335]